MRKSNFAGLAAIITTLILTVFVESKFRASRVDKWYTERPIWQNYTEVNRTHESIKVAWEPVQNSGFHYVTEIERCERNDTYLRSTKLVMYPSGN